MWYFSCYTGLIEGNRLYAVNINVGLLFEYDLEDFSYKILAKIQFPNRNKPVRVWEIVKIENVFYFILEDTYNVWKYNLDTDKLTIIKNEAYNSSESTLFINNAAFRKNDMIYLMPYYDKETISIFDCKREKFKGEIQFTNSKNADKELLYLGIRKESVWIAIFNSSYLVEVNLQSGKEKFYIIEEKHNILGASLCGNDFLLLLTETGLVKWNPEDQIISKYALSISNIEEQKIVFHNAFETDTSMIIVPDYEPCIWIIDKATGNKNDIIYPDGFKKIHPNPERCLFMKVINNSEELILLPFSANMFIRLDLKQNKMYSAGCALCWEDIREIHTVIRENEVFTFVDYVRKLVDGINDNNLKKESSNDEDM